MTSAGNFFAARIRSLQRRTGTPASLQLAGSIGGSGSSAVKKGKKTRLGATWLRSRRFPHPAGRPGADRLADIGRSAGVTFPARSRDLHPHRYLAVDPKR